MKLSSIQTIKTALIVVSIFLFYNASLADILVKEDFSTGSLPSGWTNTVLQGNDVFRVTKDEGIMNSTSGTYYAMFNDELYGALQGNEAQITSFAFDCSGRTNIKLEFQHYWEGIEYTHGYVEISNDNGSTWTTLSDFEKDGVGSLNSPEKTIIDITANVTGSTNAKVRFRYLDAGYTHKFWYIDDIIVYADPDVGISELMFPEPLNCDTVYSTAENITVRLTNYSPYDVSNIDITCKVNSKGAQVYNQTTNYAGVVPAEDYVDVTFATTIDMSDDAEYNFTAYTSLAGDEYLFNDTLYASRHQAISTFPYTENYDGNHNGWIPGGDGTTGTREFSHGEIPYLNGDEGNSDSWYLDVTGDRTDGNVWVESPIYNFSEVTNPELSMDIKYRLTSNSNKVFVAFSLDAGSSWSPLGTHNDPDWYNSGYNPSGGDGCWNNNKSYPVDTWTQVKYDLCELSGESCVMFRITTQSLHYDGSDSYFAFDNFAIDAGEPDDVQPLQILLPGTGLCTALGATETVKVAFRNNTCRPLYDVPFSIQIDGGALVYDTVSGPIPAVINSKTNSVTDIYIYDLTNTINLSSTAAHTITIKTLLSTDGNAANDTLTEIRRSLTPINSYPLLQTFDNSNEGWASRSDTSTRMFILDTVPYLNGAEGNNKSWYLDVKRDETAEQVLLESPIFDFDSLTNPMLTMDLKYQLRGNNNRLYVDFTVDGGSTWEVLGTHNDENWYNSSYDAPNGDGSWNNNAGNPVDSWTKVKYALCDFGGIRCVKFRIRTYNLYYDKSEAYFAMDNFMIREGADVGALSIVDPAEDICLYDVNQSITVKVYNWGCSDMFNVPITCYVGGDFPVTLTGTVPKMPKQKDTTYTFAQTINMTNIGMYTFQAFTHEPTDIDNANDTTGIDTIYVEFPKISNFPYTVDYNNSRDAWLPRRENESITDRNFVYGSFPYLNGSAANDSCFYLEMSGNGWNKNVYVESPVFNFKLNAIDNPMISFDIKYELYSSSNRVFLEYNLGGSSWTKVGVYTDEGWYNSTNHAWANNDGNPVDEWTTVQHSLCDLAEEECVKFRIATELYYGETNKDYFAFDNMRIYNAGDSTDVGAIDVTSPAPNQFCLYSENQTVTVNVYNWNCVDVNNVPITCVVTDGNDAIITTLTGTVPTIEKDKKVAYTFTGTFDMTPIREYYFRAYTHAGDDVNRNNDTSATLFINVEQTTIVPRYNHFEPIVPSRENFNADSAHWISGGDRTNREFRYGAMPFLGGLDSVGSKYWWLKSKSDGSGDVYVESNVYDLTNVDNPFVSLDLIYELTNTGTNDWMQLQVSTGGGWIPLGVHNHSAYTDWYDDYTTSYGGIYGWHNRTQLQWKTFFYSLCSYTNNSCVKFRIATNRANYKTMKFAFDNFRIFSGGEDDVTPVAIYPPGSGSCSGFDYNETLSIVVNNNTCKPLYDIPVIMDLTGALSQNLIDTIPVIDMFSCVYHTFEDTLNMSTTGDYLLTLTTELAADTTPDNDEFIETRTSTPIVVSSFSPYTVNFDDDNDEWAANRIDGRCERYFIRDTLPNTYLSGDETNDNGKSWYLDVSSADFENPGGDPPLTVFIETPVFDFSNLSNPAMEFDAKYSFGKYNVVRVKYSTDDGASWNNLGVDGDPDWYNDKVKTAGYNNSWNYATQTTWTRMKHDLCGIVANLPKPSCVKFRIYAELCCMDTPPEWNILFNSPNDVNAKFAIDNFTLYDSPDIEAISMSAPNFEPCLNMSNDSVVFTLHNESCADIDTVPLTCRIDGPVSYLIQDTLNVFYKDTDTTWKFYENVDLTTPGTYYIKVYSAYLYDIFNANDTLYDTIRVEQIRIDSFPYAADFNNSDEYWLPRSTVDGNYNREFKRGLLPYLGGRGDNGSSWYLSVKGDGSHTTRGDVYVESPVFDFTGIGNPILSMDIKYQLAQNSNRVHVDYSTNGGTSWTKLGSNLDDNWYNSSYGTNGSWNHNLANPVDQWTNVEYKLCNLKDASCVKFRIRTESLYYDGSDAYFAFDNFYISNNIIDAEVLDVTGCWGSTYDLEVVVRNNDLLSCEGVGTSLATGGTDTASSAYSNNYTTYGAHKAFDGDISTHWISLYRDITTNGFSWLEYDIDSLVIVDKYSLYCGWSASYLPKKWAFQAYDESASAWITLDSVSNSGNEGLLSSDWRDFYFDNTTAYKKYRLYIHTSLNNDYVSISELKLLVAEKPIQDLLLSYYIDGVVKTQQFSGLDIEFAEYDTLIFNNVYVPSDQSTFKVWCSSPNGMVDYVIHNDTLTPDLSYWPNCNDHCSNAIEIVSNVSSFSSTRNATSDTLEDPPLYYCGSPSLENTVWYKFTTSCMGGDVKLTIDSFQNLGYAAGYNTGKAFQISLDTVPDGYSPCDVANYYNVACSDTAGQPDGMDSVVFYLEDLPPNKTFYLTLDGSSGYQSDFRILLSGSVDLSDAGNDTLICPGDTASLTAKGGDSYEWNNGATTESITVVPNDTTTYYVTITTGTCDKFDSVTVNVMNSTDAQITGKDLICKGLSTTLTASGGTGYLWNTGSGSTSINISPLVTTTYTVDAFSGNCIASDTMVVEVVEVLPNLDDTVGICSGGNIDLTVNLSGAGNNYLWSNNDTTVTTNVSPTIATPYYVTVTDTNGCEGIDTTFVKMVTELLVNTGDDTAICIGESISLSANVSGTGYSYIWTPATGLNSDTATNPLANPDTTTTYFVEVSVNTCTGIDTIVLSVNPLPDVDIQTDKYTVCLGDAAKLSIPYTSSILWNTGSTDSLIYAIPTASDSIFTVKATNSFNCKDSSSITINTKTIDLLTPSATIVCINVGASSTLTVTNPVQGATYQWYDSDTSSISLATGTSYTALNISDDSTFYVKGFGGCFGDRIAVPVVKGTVLDSSFTYSPDEIYPFEIIDFTATELNGVKYDWSFGDNTSGTSQTTTHSYKESGDFPVTLTVTSSDGCISYKSEMVNVELLTSIYVPSAFSPNGDTENETLLVFGEDIGKINFNIFNQWGIKVYSTSDVAEATTVGRGWDGTFDGEKQPVGNYVFMLEAWKLNGDAHTPFQGVISLVR